MFEIAKTNILGWPGGNSSKQVRLIHIHASRHDSVTLAQPTQARSCLWTLNFDQSQTSIQHNYQCDFMNYERKHSSFSEE